MRRNVEVPIGERGRQVYYRLVNLLTNLRCPFFVGGASTAHRRRIHIHQNDLPMFLKSAASEMAHLNAKVYVKSGQAQSLIPLAHFNSFASPPPLIDIVIAERTAKTATPILDYISFVEIDCWCDVKTYSCEQLLEPQRTNKLLNRITRNTFKRLSKGCDLDAEAHDIVDPDFPVDAVITWVDDQDPHWQQEKNSRAMKLGRPTSRALHSERFRNRDELKYCLRSIEQFAPFFRNIYLVTAGQTPAWLNTSHPLLKLVHHQDIYKDKSALPTFNSSGIETQLHHIDGLAEHFVYFNDDFFIGQLSTPEDFFYANGLLKYFPSDQRAVKTDIDDSREEYLVADKNALHLLAGRFGRSNREIMLHSPYPSSKSLLAEMESEFPAAFDTCAAEPFRSPRDIRPIAFMQYHYGFALKKALPTNIANRYIALWKPTVAEQLDNLLLTRRHQTFCINDVGLEPHQTAFADHLVDTFLEHYFPLKSQFEKA